MGCAESQNQKFSVLRNSKISGNSFSGENTSFYNEKWNQERDKLKFEIKTLATQLEIHKFINQKSEEKDKNEVNQQYENLDQYIQLQVKVFQNEVQLQCKEYESKLKQQTEENLKLQNEIQRNLKEITELKQQNQQLNQQIAQLKSVLLQQKEKIQQKEQLIKKLQQESESFSLENSSMKYSIHDKNVQKTQSVEQMQQLIETYKNQILLLQTQLQKQQQISPQSNHKLVEEQKIMKDFQTQIENVIKDGEQRTLLGENKNFLSQIQKLEHNLSEKQKENQQLNQKLEQIQIEKAHLRENYENEVKQNKLLVAIEA